MPRTPHSRTRPPAPKERPTALAVSGAPRPALGSPPARGGGGGDMVGFWVFTALVVLGLIAAARAFVVM